MPEEAKLGPWGVPTNRIDLERRLFGDAERRNHHDNGGTGEYDERWNEITGRVGTNLVMFERNTLETRKEFRNCLLQLGMDDPACKTYIGAFDSGTQALVQRDVLGHFANQEPEGLCGIPSQDKTALSEDDLLLGGTRLRSAKCNMFCKTSEARKSGYCVEKLKEFCQSQPDEQCNEDMCDCWLPKETYEKIRQASYANMGGEDSDIVVRIKKAMDESKPQDNCWWKPCQNTGNGPMDCIGGEFYQCTIVNRDLNLNAGNDVKDRFVCGYYVLLSVTQTNLISVAKQLQFYRRACH